ncbi:MAG TPA: Fic family protein [Candidatus Wunengus sp. YC60]|uniref:Fic family protein n=1 Tax=Candidatus Wunengus sp. YC60 TaxID=3367697 RepID=UPI004027EE9D
MRSGTYINQLEGETRYKAFVPNELPFVLQSDPNIPVLLSRADMALGRLDGVGDILPNVDFFILMYVRKEATLSSQIEGTQATFTDVLKAEAKIEDLEIHKDVDEVLNYIKAMNYGLQQLDSIPLSIGLIKQIHEKLLSGVRGEWKSPGEFRRSQNWIGGASINTATFVPPPHTEVMRLMGNLETFLHNEDQLPVLIKTAIMHAQFETIHPFLDGNGRIGRLLLTFYLCQQGILRRPLLYLSDFFKAHRQAYYDALNAYRVHDDIEGWLKFFLEGVRVTSEKATESARKINELRESHLKAISTLGRSTRAARQLLDHIYSSPMIRVSDVERITKLSNPSALYLVDRFEKLGILHEVTGKKRNRVFAYQDYIALFS